MTFLRIVSSFVFLILASCSSYQRDFEEAKKSFRQAQSPEGPWLGNWKSNHNGHHGPLWCIVSQDEDPNYWNFRYRAGWGALEFGDYVHRVQTTLEKDGSMTLDSSMKLPANLGVYHVEGTIFPEEFHVRFQGNGDHGTMMLSRP